MKTIADVRAPSVTPPRPASRRRWPRWVAATTVAALAIVYAGAGWYISDQIISSVRVQQDPPQYDTAIVDVDATQITLRAPDRSTVTADRDAVMGLRWDGGYGRIGPTATLDGDLETRPFTLLAGSPPPVGDGVAEYHGYAFPSVPADLPFDIRTVTYPSPLGDLEAWHLPGRGSTWIIGVHGRGNDRPELLRMVDATDELDYPTLLVRYRNDPGGPVTEGSLVLFGQDEWTDVEAAVDHALANGATDVVIYGASLGGAISLGYALNEPRDVIRGLILESPAADLREAARLRSGEALPVGGPIGDSLLAVGRLFVWLRTGLDFDTIDYVDRADELTVPTLLFHGTDDTTVPFEISQSLARSRPDLVEFHPIDDGAHVRAWNEDPEGYTASITAFLERIGRN